MKKLLTILIAITALFIWNCEDPNEAPEVSAIAVGDVTPGVGETVTFSITASDNEDNVLTVLWVATAGTFADATLEEVEWTAPDEAGVVTITVTVSDGDLETSITADVTVRLLEAPDVSAITVGNDAPVFGEEVTFSASATDEDSDVLTTAWTATHGTFADATLEEVVWTAPGAEVTATITVTYSDGINETSVTTDVVVGVPTLTYSSSVVCGDCHTAIYADFIDSGHPYKFNLVKNATPPTYPSFVDNYIELPSFVGGWDEIAGVVGGFGWKFRFVGTDGHLIGTDGSMYNLTGSNQFNFYEGYNWGWVDYHADGVDDVKKYNYGCFKCHTTGGVETTNPDSSWLKVHLDITDAEPMDYFEFGGIQCEACHGKGSAHVASNGNKNYIDLVTTSRLEGTKDVTDLCGDCHTRNADRSIAVSGGLVKHHEQYDEFITTAHYDGSSPMSCTTCHDPHKRVVWDGDAIQKTCGTDCHDTKTTMAHNAAATCQSCHMPYSAKSAVARGPYTGDVKSHLWAINTDPAYEFLNDDGATVRVVDGKAKLSLQFACYGCHTDENGVGGYAKAPGDTTNYSPKTLAQLAAMADGMHN